MKRNENADNASSVNVTVMCVLGVRDRFSYRRVADGWNDNAPKEELDLPTVSTERRKRGGGVGTRKMEQRYYLTAESVTSPCILLPFRCPMFWRRAWNWLRAVWDPIQRRAVQDIRRRIIQRRRILRRAARIYSTIDYYTIAIATGLVVPLTAFLTAVIDTFLYQVNRR